MKDTSVAMDAIHQHPAYEFANSRVKFLVREIDYLISVFNITIKAVSYDGSVHFLECFNYFDTKPEYVYDEIDGPCVCVYIDNMIKEALDILNSTAHPLEGFGDGEH